MRRLALGLGIAAALGLTAFLLVSLFGEGGGGGSADDTPEVVDARDGEDELAHLKGTASAGASALLADAVYVIAGRVVDQDGSPVAGCRVGVKRSSGSQLDPRDPSTWTRGITSRWGGLDAHGGYSGIDDPLALRFVPTQEAVTTELGTFELPVDGEGSWRVRALVDPPLVSTAGSAWVSPTRTRAHVDLRLVKGSRLEGCVVDAAGRGVAAVVRGFVRQDGRSQCMADPVETDATDGRFSYAALPTGEGSFTVTIPGRLQLRGLEVELPHDGVWTIRLDRVGGAVEGRVTDVAGTGVEGATVVVQVGGSRFAPVGAARGTSGADGAYRLEGLPAEAVTRVLAGGEGHLPYDETPPDARWSGARIEKGRVTKIDVTLHGGATVTGTVRERGTGRPLADVEVFLLSQRSSGGYPQAIPNTRTDATGRYVLEGATPGLHVLVARSPTHYLPALEAETAGFVSVDPFGRQTLPHPPPQLMVLVGKNDTSFERDFELAKGHRVRGRVLSPDGEGVAGAEVLAEQEGLGTVAWRWGVEWPAWGVPIAVTGRDGRFVADNVPPREALALSASKAPWISSEGVTVRVRAGEESEEVLIRLAHSVAIEGRVLGPDGEGIDAAVNGYAMSGFGRGSAYANTGPDGSFRLANLPAGRVRLTATSRNYGSATVTLEAIPPGETKQGVELVLRAGVRVSGTLVDQHGQPVARQRISIRPVEAAKRGDTASATTDEHGDFVIEHAKEGRLQALVVRRAGGTYQQTDVGGPFDSPIDGLRLTLEVPQRVLVEATIIGPDGRPIPICRAEVGPAGKTRDRRLGMPSADPTVTNDVLFGVLRREVEGEPPFEIRVTAPRDERGKTLNLAVATVRVENPDAGRIEIRLEEGLEFGGRVVDAEGHGVEGVGLRLGSAHAVTGTDGAFSMGGLEGSERSLQITPPGGWVRPSVRTVQVEGETVEIVLVPATAVAGVVRDAAGKALSGHGYVQASWKKTGDTPAGNANAQVQSGAFRVEGIPHGVTVHLVVRMYGGSARTPPLVRDVEAGTLDLVLEVAGGPGLAGVVVDESGKPLAGIGLSIQREGAPRSSAVWVRTEDDGAFRVTGLESGAWTIRVTRGGEPYPVEAVRVTVPADDLRIVVPAPRSITGRLVGEGVDTSWRVEAWRDGAPGSRVARPGKVGADGRFEIEGLGTTRVVLVAEHRDHDRFARSDPLVPGARDVTLRLQAGERIEGTVVDASGAGLASGRVRARSDTWSASAWSKEGGGFVFRGLPPGRYRLSVTRRGASGEGEVVEVATGSTNIQLRAP